MKNIHIVSLESLDSQHVFSLVVASPKELVWQYKQIDFQGELDFAKLSSLLVSCDYVLLRQSNLVYPRPDTIDCVCVIGSDDVRNPLVLVALKSKQLNHEWLTFSDLRVNYGKVYIAGFGPGNPDLLTIKTERLMQQADVIFYDDLLDASFLDGYAAEKHYVGKRKGQHSAAQDQINELLLKAALSGRMVVRLKGGDPLVFGRGGEEFHHLAFHFVSAEIIPGITSALAAAAAGVIPLTSRGISTSVAFTLGHDAIHNKLPQADTLVFYMGASQQKVWAARLLKEGWPSSTPVAAVRYASMPNQEIKRYTLGQLTSADEVLAAPSLVIVGYTASEDIKSMGRKWLYTGTNVNDFKEEGMLVHNPMIAIKPCELDDSMTHVLNNLSSYNRILFPTPFSVRELFRLLNQMGLDARALYPLQLTSIGDATSAMLKKYGLLVPPETSDNTSESLIETFRNKGVVNDAILLPCSSKGLNLLPKGLRELGNQVDTFAIYHTQQPENISKHNLDDFYGVVFTSPTTVRNFFKIYNHFPAHLEVRAGGKYTMGLFDQLVKNL